MSARWGEALNMAWNGTAGPTGSEGSEAVGVLQRLFANQRHDPGALLYDGN